ncbi:hypothetical protein ALC60_01316, partial [Trachymyrmex zeteki]
LDILNELVKSDFLEIFSNLAIALWILLTVSISVATAEASFSKLKICFIISIKKELANNLDYVIDLEDVIRIFSKAKARKCNSMLH